VSSAWLSEAWLVVRAERSFNNQRTGGTDRPKRRKETRSVRDTVTRKKNKMGAACKTSVALQAGAGKGQGQGQVGVFRSDGTRIQRRGRMSVTVFVSGRGCDSRVILASCCPGR
jgi:hypothetical protein